MSIVNVHIYSSFTVSWSIINPFVVVVVVVVLVCCEWAARRFRTAPRIFWSFLLCFLLLPSAKLPANDSLLALHYPLLTHPPAISDLNHPRLHATKLCVRTDYHQRRHFAIAINPTLLAKNNLLPFTTCPPFYVISVKVTASSFAPLSLCIQDNAPTSHLFLSQSA